MRQWWSRLTIRFRLAVVWSGLGGLVLIGGFSAALYFYVSATMGRPLDEELREDLAEIRRRLVVAPGDELRWDGAPLPAAAAWDPQYPWFELWNERGALVCRLWPFSESRVENLPTAPERGRDRISIYNVARDLRLRVLSVPYEVPGRGEPLTIRVMTVHRPLAQALVPLRWIIYLALPVLGALLVLGGYTLTRRWLKPLDVMVAEANRISAADLTRRLPVENPHDELGRLALVFNETLDRLEAAFVALDQFVANASHELRTPLTTLRNVGEVGLRRDRTAGEYREIIGSMLEEAQRLERLVQRLLELASMEAAAAAVPRGPFRLDEEVSACAAELGILAETKQQEIALELAPCSARGDPVIFRQALQNLLDNAIKFSPEGATLRVAVGASGGFCRVAVTDEGPGISLEHREQIGTRFFRAEAGRGRSRGGVGLGLALTKAYMRVLAGTLEFRPAEPRGSTFTLTLPQA